MKITAIKTRRVGVGDDLWSLLDESVKNVKEGSVLAITSKIIALSEGRVAPIGSVSKDALIFQESELYLPRSASKYDVSLAIARGDLVAYAGIDESNADGYYVLWPSDAFRSAALIRSYIKRKFGVRKIGVVVTDSRATPLRWGTTGFALAWSGFEGLKNYIGKPDLFGRRMKMTKANVADGLAAAAVVLMGEGSERTPLALLEDLNFVHFAAGAPTSREKRSFRIGRENDLYAPLLKGARWKRGAGS